MPTLKMERSIRCTAFRPESRASRPCRPWAGNEAQVTKSARKVSLLPAAVDVLALVSSTEHSTTGGGSPTRNR